MIFVKPCIFVFLRNELHDDLFEKVSETRREAFDAIAKVRQKYGGTKGEPWLKYLPGGWGSSLTEDILDTLYFLQSSTFTEGGPIAC